MTNTQLRIARYLCESAKPCEKHTNQAIFITELVEQDRAKHREEEAQRALDRLVGDVVTEGTHAV